MKKLQSITVALFASVVCFLGCKNNYAPPEITFGDSAVATVAKGESKEVAVAVKTKGKLKRVSFFQKNASGEEELFGTPVVKFPNKERYESVITLQDITAGVVFVVEAVDAKDQTSRAEYVIALADSTASTAETPASAAPAAAESRPSSYTGGGIELGFHKNPVGSSYRVDKKKVSDLYWAMQYSNSVDFMFFYGKNSGVNIVAPSDDLALKVFSNEGCGVAQWETRNSTTLTKSSVSFDGAALADVETELNAVSTTNVAQLKEGDVVAFKTASGKIGLVKILYAGSDKTSTLNIDVKVLN